jgi:ATP-binding cassette subfamily B multidrug efflux pump
VSAPHDDDLDDDFVSSKAWDSSILRRLAVYARPHFRLFAASFCVLAVLFGLELLGPWIWRHALDGPVLAAMEARSRDLGAETGPLLRQFWSWVALYVGVVVLSIGFRYLEVAQLNHTGQAVIADLRSRLFRHMQSLDLSFFDKRPTGALVTRVTGDVENLNEMFTSGLIVLMFDFVKVVGLLIFIFLLNWKLALVVLGGTPFLIGVSLVFRGGARSAHRAVRARLSRLNGYLQEVLQGIRVVQVFRREKQVSGRFAAHLESYLEANLRTIFLFALFFPVIDFVVSAIQGSTLWVGGLSISRGNLTYGEFVQFWFYVAMLVAPIRELGERYNILQSAFASAERIFDILDTRSKLIDAPELALSDGRNAVDAQRDLDERVLALRDDGNASGVQRELDARGLALRDDRNASDAQRELDKRVLALRPNDIASSTHPATRAPHAVDKSDVVSAALRVARTRNDGRTSAPRGHVRFEHVTFSYDSGVEVLHDVSFEIAPGKTVAVVGATGAGKSTLVNLLLRFYDPTEGRITIDGVDLCDYDVRKLRRHYGLVLQEDFLFAGTVHENLVMEREEVSDESLALALEASRADEVIARLPGGLHAPVAERGTTFSTGERQLLAIARALAGSPAIVILDEATASVDSGTEAQIEAATRELLAGRSALVVAHRLSTVRRADAILVMHRGRLREQGTHEELLALNGIYARLHALQFSGEVPTA